MQKENDKTNQEWIEQSEQPPLKEGQSRSGSVGGYGQSSTTTNSPGSSSSATPSSGSSSTKQGQSGANTKSDKTSS